MLHPDIMKLYDCDDDVNDIGYDKSLYARQGTRPDSNNHTQYIMLLIESINFLKYMLIGLTSIVVLLVLVLLSFVRS